MYDALVVYESMYGNTQDIAEAVAEGLHPHVGSLVVEVSNAPTELDNLALLVVGGPTHAHGLSTPTSRSNASDRRPDTPLVSAGEGVREWLGRLRIRGDRPPAAAFSTRLRGPEAIWGNAARGIGRRLRDHGYELLAPPEAFLVYVARDLPTHALLAGEIERARDWGEQLATPWAEHQATARS